MTWKSICFDLDDTLYPYHRYARTGLKNAAEYLEDSFGLEIEEELYKLYFDEEITSGTFDCVVSEYDEIPPSLIDDLIDAFHSSTATLQPYESTNKLLGSFQQNGYRLGLITDGRNGHEKLNRLGLTKFFNSIVVTTEIGVTKHYREPFDRALNELSVAPEQVVYVGDDPRVDFRKPNELGMGTVRLRRGRFKNFESSNSTTKADVEISSLDQLPQVLTLELGRPQ